MDKVPGGWYKKVDIEYTFVKLEQGGWKADFTLTETIDSNKISTPYAGRVAFQSREAVMEAASDDAQSIIDKKYPTVLPRVLP